MRAAVIGCGKIGSEFSDDPRVKGIYSHAGAYAASSRIELAAVCDADPLRSERCARRWNLRKGYTDVAELMAEEKPEIVSVCTPDDTHVEILQRVLASPYVKGILAEKPLAMTASDGAEIASAAAAKGVVLALNYIRRYAAGHRAIKSLLASDAMGDIQSVAGLYSGGLLHNGSHWLDASRWLVGEIVAVQSFPRDHPCSPGDFSADVRLEFASGATGFLQACRSDAFGIFEFDIIGMSGRVRFVDSGHLIHTFSVGDSPYYSGYRALLRRDELPGGVENVMVNAVEDLVTCVADGGVPQCSGSDGVAALRVVEAIRRSALRGGRVEVLVS